MFLNVNFNLKRDLRVTNMGTLTSLQLVTHTTALWLVHSI